MGFVVGFLVGAGDRTGPAGGVFFGGAAVLGAAALGVVCVCAGFLSFCWGGSGSFVTCDGVGAVDGVGLAVAIGFGVLGAFGAGPAAVGVFDTAAVEG